MNFILDEDEALRDRLLGMTVSDNKNPDRPVGVWFGQPDVEIRAQAFPFITIDLIDVTEARERVMSGMVDPWYYTPDGLDPETQGWEMYYPTPINLDYQVTTFARQPRHDRQILGQLLGSRLPARFGSMTVKAIDNGDGTFDGTVRRLDLLNVVKRDMTESGKRLFMNVFTVRVSSEIPQPYDFQTFYKALEVRLSTGTTSSTQVLDPVTQVDLTVPTQTGTP